MLNYYFLIPIGLLLGFSGLAAFLWTLASGQYDDIEGSAHRILFEDDAPVRPAAISAPPPPRTTAAVRPGRRDDPPGRTTGHQALR